MSTTHDAKLKAQVDHMCARILTVTGGSDDLIVGMALMKAVATIICNHPQDRQEDLEFCIAELHDRVAELSDGRLNVVLNIVSV